MAERKTRPDTPADLRADAEVLHDAMAILRGRSMTHKYDDLADQVRHVAVELESRARHPSRQHLRGGAYYKPEVREGPGYESSER
jgi:hypothetical protein